MTKHITMMLGALSIAGMAMGCTGAAWSMRRGDWSGELALHGPMLDAQNAAHDAMTAHCGGRARIVEGAEAERVAAADDTTRPPREVDVDTTGRRVHYVCISRAPLEFRSAHGTPAATAHVVPARGGL
jgi:hypothetical protein